MSRAQRALWQERIARWRESGLKGREFAEQEGVNVGTLTSWKYKLAALNKRSAMAAAQTEPVAFVEVTESVSAPAVSTSGERLEVVCGGGRTVRVPKDFDAAALGRLLDVLESR